MTESKEFKIGPSGYLELNERPFPYIARLKPDKCLKSDQVRQIFHPNSFVEYSLDKLYKDESDDITVYLATVKKVGSSDKEAYPVPLCMLELTAKQKAEIISVKRYPKKAFEKTTSMLKEENFPSDNIIENFGEEILIAVDEIDSNF